MTYRDARGQTRCRLRRAYRSLKMAVVDYAPLHVSTVTSWRALSARHKKAPDDAGAFELLI
jgi:hypothetical protein